MSDELRRYFYSLMTDEAKGTAASFLKTLLSLLSFLYYCALSFTVFLYKKNILKSYKPACKVISVGNITIGGTGKTPLTAEIARKFKEKGKRVVILTRGYMRNAKTGIADEAELFKKSLDGVPVIVGRDRIASAKEAEAKYSPDIILLDDGFQHWRLKRDIDVVTVDVDLPFGNGALIPRGILREPVSSLARAQLVVVTKVLPEEAVLGRAEILKRRIGEINPAAVVFNASFYPKRLYDITGSYGTSVNIIEGKPVALLCAIADPSSFEDTVVSLGASIAANYYFMDHHIFTSGEINRIMRECVEKKIDTIITTEKDLPRLQRIVLRQAQDVSKDAERSRSTFSGQRTGIKILVLGVEMKINREEEFFGRLDPVFIS